MKQLQITSNENEKKEHEIEHSDVRVHYTEGPVAYSEDRYSG